MANQMTARPEAPTLDAEKHAKMRDMVMSWEEISDELIWGDYDMNGPDIQKISPDRLEVFCKRFPHFEEQLRSFADDWNREPMITQEMLAAIEHTEVSQEEIDKSWRSAKRILDFYTKLRSVEKQRDDLRERLRAIEQAAGKDDLIAFLLSGAEISDADDEPEQAQMFRDCAASIHNLTTHCLHVKDRLARMEALLREPDEGMMGAGDDAISDGLTKAQLGIPYGLHPEHASWNVWKAMSAALLSKLEKEKQP